MMKEAIATELVPLTAAAVAVDSLDNNAYFAGCDGV